MTKARTLADNFAADINAVTADAPLTGGGTSGTVTVGIQAGTTAQSGAVQLTDSTASTSTTSAATPNSVKSAYDLANGAIPKSLVDAKGDLLVGSANDTVSRLAVTSTAGYVLTVDSAEATGLKWAAVPSSSGPAFRATRSSTDQSITSGAYTKLQFNVETFDTDSCYDSTTNYRFTPNKAGYYFVYLGAYFAANTGSSVILRLYKNGSVYLPNVWGSGNLAPQYASPTGSSFVYLNGSTDYIEAYGYHGGTNPVFAGEQELAQFCAFWVRS